jgi:hypothetical protein
MDETFKATVVSQLRALEPQIARAYEKGSNCHWKVGETLNNIRRSMIDTKPESERSSLEKLVAPIDFKIPEREAGGPYTVPGQEAYRLYSQLAALLQQNQLDSATAPERERGHNAPRRHPLIFLGHGGSRLWARVKLYLEDELGVATVSYESESRVGESIVPVLEGFLDQATFAVLVLTGGGRYGGRSAQSETKRHS